MAAFSAVSSGNHSLLRKPRIDNFNSSDNRFRPGTLSYYHNLALAKAHTDSSIPRLNMPRLPADRVLV
jgi:hypothetical protein